MSALRSFFAPRMQLLQQQQEIKQLREEISKLQTQNDSMRAGMRRCLSCDYRIDFKKRRAAAGSGSTEE